MNRRFVTVPGPVFAFLALSAALAACGEDSGTPAPVVECTVSEECTDLELGKCEKAVCAAQKCVKGSKGPGEACGNGGTCGEDGTCTGEAEPEPEAVELSCDNVQFEGCCTPDNVLYYCDPDTQSLEENECAGGCGWNDDPEAGYYDCNSSLPSPDASFPWLCPGETCDDPCGGVECGFRCGMDCGGCSGGEVCTDNKCGAPKVPCGDIDIVGCCTAAGGIAFCQDDELMEGTCGDGNVCGWDPEARGGAGWYDCVSQSFGDPSGENPFLCPGETCAESCDGKECGTACAQTCGVCEGDLVCEEGKCIDPDAPPDEAADETAEEVPDGGVPDADGGTTEVVEDAAEDGGTTDEGPTPDSAEPDGGDAAEPDGGDAADSGGPIQPGACTNPADQTVLDAEDTDMLASSVACGAACEEDATETCVSDCLVAATSLSKACAGCWVAAVLCAYEQCPACTSDFTSDACTGCAGSTCLGGLTDCTGIQ